MINPNTDIKVCIAELEAALSGYRGYPPTQSGVRRFAEALQMNCVSVGHLRAVLASFEEFFPTIKEIHDVAWNTRAKFEPAEDTVAEWTRIYGKPQKFNVTPVNEMAMHWQAIRDTLYYTEGPGELKLLELPNVKPLWQRANDQAFWAQSRQQAFAVHRDTVDFVRQQVKELGWPAIMALDSSPVPFPYTSPQWSTKHRPGNLVPVGAPITQADIDRAAGRRKTTAEVDSQLDGWDDPDR